MRFLITTHADPKFMPPVFLDPQEIVAGPNYNRVVEKGKIRFWGLPWGESDFMEMWAAIPAAQKPDVILVHADISCDCLPHNFPPGVPRILLVGGATHILDSPLRTMLTYAMRGQFDAVMVWNRHNAHFFAEAGLPNVFWMPGLIMGVPKVRRFEQRRLEVAFFGQVGKYHPRRIRLIERFKSSGLPIYAQPLPRLEGLERFASSLIAFNVSLNGEFNMRVFEATSTGAMLLTDRLSPHLGLDIFFQDGESMVLYDTEAEMIEKATYYLAHPQEAMRIGLRGKQVYEQHFTAEARRRTFLSLIQGDAVPGAYRLKDEPRCQMKPAATEEERSDLLQRIALYEWFQELHRNQEKVDVDIVTPNFPLIVSDLSDLIRVELRLRGAAYEHHEAIATPLQRLGARYTTQPPQGQPGHVLIADPTILDEDLLQTLATHPYQAVYMAGLDPDAATLCDPIFAELGYTAWPRLRGLYLRHQTAATA